MVTVAVGVPAITPLEVSKVNPAGSAGDIEYETAPEISAFVKPMVGVMALPDFPVIVTADGAIRGSPLFTVKVATDELSTL